MNKWQIICPTAALLLSAAVVAVIHGRNSHQGFAQAETRQIGHDLVTSTNSSRIVTLGHGLRGRLETLLTHPAGVSEVLLGDEPGLGDGEASSRVILTNSAGEKVGIRFRVDGSTGKSHVLGFWTIH